MRFSKPLSSGVFLIVSLAFAAVASADGVTFLVRHAEKAATGEDPELTEAGVARARALAALLAESEIEAVYTTDTRRTRETARPVAEDLGIEPIVYDGRRLEDLALELVAKGQRALVVGHSNTTPALVGKMGGDAGEPISEDEYSRLYVVFETDGVVTTLRLELP